MKKLTKISAAVLLISSVILVLCVRFLHNSSRDRQPGQEYVTTESAAILGQEPIPTHNPWGRTRTIDGFFYSTVPAHLCRPFINDLHARDLFYSQIKAISINQHPIDLTSPEWVDDMTNACHPRANSSVEILLQNRR